MLMVSGVELGFRHHLHEVWKLKRRYAARFKKQNERSGKIIDIRYMRQNVVSDSQVDLPAFIRQLPRQLTIKKPLDDLQALPSGFRGRTSRRFHSVTWNALLLHELQQIT